MAVEKINYSEANAYGNKVAGQKFTSNDANQIKDVVNNNADELNTVKNAVNNLGSSIGTLGSAVSGIQNSMQTPEVAQESITADIQPNKLNVWGSVARLTITFVAGTANKLNEYMLRFTVGASDFTLTLPPGIRWVTEPDWEEGHTYEVSIIDNLAVCAGWEAAAS